MARIDTIRVTKQADVEVELAKRSRNKQLREAVSMSERHAPFSSQGDKHILLPYIRYQDGRSYSCHERHDLGAGKGTSSLYTTARSINSYPRQHTYTNCDRPQGLHGFGACLPLHNAQRALGQDPVPCKCKQDDAEWWWTRTDHAYWLQVSAAWRTKSRMHTQHRSRGQLNTDSRLVTKGASIFAALIVIAGALRIRKGKEDRHRTDRQFSRSAPKWAR